MLKVQLVIASFLLLTVGSTDGTADTIALVSNASPAPGGSAVCSTQYLQTSWTQSAGYTNVTISAWLFGTYTNGGYTPSSGTAYLTSTVPGEYWEYSFVFPDPQNSTQVVLFSGLNLKAGTYFLTLVSSDPVGGGWSDSLNGGPGSTTTLGAGVTLGSFTFTPPANVNVSNPPESTFIAFNPSSTHPFFDVIGNPVSEPVPSYSVCLLYDSTRPVRIGSTIPIKLQLCNSSGNDLSSSAITLHATGVTQTSASTSGAVQDSGNANPDTDFRFDLTLGTTGGYIFNLKTNGLTTGSYNLKFTATGDSSVYGAPFQVK